MILVTAECHNVWTALTDLTDQNQTSLPSFPNWISLCICEQVKIGTDIKNYPRFNI